MWYQYKRSDRREDWTGCAAAPYGPLEPFGTAQKRPSGLQGPSRPSPSFYCALGKIRGPALPAMASWAMRPMAAPGELRPTGSSRGDGGAQTASRHIPDLFPIIAGIETC